MAKSGEQVHADMRACRPREALKRECSEGTWLLVDYETAYGLKGVMVYSDPKLNSARLELLLQADGLHEIFLGVNYTKSPYGMVYSGYSGYGNLEVKLSNDLGFTRVAAEPAGAQDPCGPPGAKLSKLGKGKNVAVSIQETYWKTADLTGQSLFIQPATDPYNSPKYWGIANLSYVRLVPLTEREEADWQRLQPTRESRRVTHLYCAGNLSGHIDGGVEYHPTSIDWFKSEMQPLLDSDVDMLCLEGIRGHYCTFRTRTGDVGGDGTWQDEWVDPLGAFTHLAHENGIKMFCAMRMIGPGFPYNPGEPLGRARFFWEHQEWVKRDREGIPTTNLSIAYPEVRAYWMSLMREALDYGLDGLVVYLNRFKPFVLYEEPTVRSFREKHGEDPRDLPEADPRWIAHGADYVTTFLSEIRDLLDERPGRELGVVHYGGPSQYDRRPDWHPIQYNCDVERWITEGLVDYLFPTQYPLVELIEKWSKLAHGRVKIRPDLMPGSQAGEDFVKQARIYYEAGADGICLRDAERRSPHLTEWGVQCRLGHREMFDYLEKAAPSYYRRVPLKTLNGFATRYSYNNFGSLDPLLVDEEK